MLDAQRLDQPVFEFPVMVPSLPEAAALAPYLARIDASHWYSNFGPLARALADRLCAHYAAPLDSVCVMANATLALTAALREAAGRTLGGLCLMPSWTFVASAHAAVASGLTPLFVDVDPLSGQITPAIAAAAAAGRDREVAAVLVVSPFGARVDPAPWERFRETTGIDVVIDAAGAFDTVSLSRLPTVVSLHATKPVASGEGAFVLCADQGLVERLRRWSNFGLDAEHLAAAAGLNAKMSEYHAAVAHASLDRWPRARRHLLALGQAFRARLAGLPVACQPGWAESWIGSLLNIRLLDGAAPGAAPGPAGVAALARLRAALAASGVETRCWWGQGCHTHPAFAGCPREALPRTEAIAATTLGLPFSPLLTPAGVETIVARLREALRQP